MQQSSRGASIKAGRRRPLRHLDETTRRENVEALWRVFDTKQAGQLSIEGLDQPLNAGLVMSLHVRHLTRHIRL